jgi:hypothetical protein
MPFKPGPTYFNDQGRNIIPDHVKRTPEYKPFFDGIAVILKALKDQNSRSTKKVSLPQDMDMTAASNYGITVQEWFDHNFRDMHGITIEWISYAA